MSDEARLTALETALAHAEAAIQDLSDLARAQAGEIAALKAETRRLRTLVLELRDQRDEGDMSYVP